MASKALQAKLTQLEDAKEELLVRIAEEKLEKPKISAEFMTFWLHRTNIRRLMYGTENRVQIRKMLRQIFAKKEPRK